jgi:hypothetical protein
MKKVTTIFLGILVLLYAIESYTEDRYALGVMANQITLADIDNNGYVDMLVSIKGSKIVSVLLNKGDGTYETKGTYTTGVSPSPVIVSDVDKDGFVDMFVSNTYDDNFFLYMNKGDGTFATGVPYDTGISPYEMTVSDLNNDGYDDLIVPCGGSAKISVYINKGDGTFKTPVAYNTGENPIPVGADDLDHDGYKDLVVSNNTSKDFSVFINKKDGTFADEVRYPVGKQSNPPVLNDINKDGYADVLLGGPESIAVFLNNGDGTFGEKSNYCMTEASTYTLFTVADLNNDGYPDLINSYQPASVEPGVMSISMNSGDGTFGTEQKFDVGLIPETPTISDINNDGHPDIIVSNYSSGDTSLFVNKGDGTFQAPKFVGFRGYSQLEALTPDVDNDGLSDIVICNMGDTWNNGKGFISVFRNLSGNIFDETPDSIAFRLRYTPSGAKMFKNGDTLGIKFDILTSTNSSVVDIYFVMLDPHGKIYSGMDWTEGIKPIAQNVYLPPKFVLKDLLLSTIAIPSESPPINFTGTFTFAFGLFDSKTYELQGDIAQISFWCVP